VEYCDELDYEEWWNSEIKNERENSPEF